MTITALADIVRHQAAERANAVALIFEDRATTYATLDRRASQVANGLIAAGVRAAGCIALLDKNHDSFYEIWFGASKVNAVLVPVNWAVGGAGDRLRHQ